MKHFLLVILHWRLSLKPEKGHQKGNYIYLPEEVSNKIYFILNGKVKIGTFRDNEKEIVTAILQTGDVFSEMSILGEKYERILLFLRQIAPWWHLQNQS